ncbi:restriction endonuclease subunit S, partial [Saccharomonospora viridis]|uniref:restriction endonuclease subunit S n=1 Tax=Saccharomonospora viridis TaxID=1852 RepID=UPI003D12FCCE
VHPTVYFPEVKAFHVCIPNVWEQEAIIAVLGALDDKIAVNERIASTSDELIRQQYLQMVGDVEDSITLGELGYLVRESVSATDLRASDNYIALEHMPRRNMWLAEWESAESVVSTKTRFIDGDVLFGKLRPYFHKVGLALTEGVCSTDILVVRPVSNYLRGWLLASLSSDDVVAHASAVGDGTRMPRAKWSDLARYDVPWVGDDRASSFNDFVTSISCQVASTLAENRTLAQLRDTLLPKLMSGQIRVRDAERMVEDAT